MKVQMRQADVIMTAADQAASALIRVATGSRYSHAILSLAGREIIHATTKEGVHSDHIENILQGVYRADVYRHCALELQQVKKIIGYAKGAEREKRQLR